MAALGIFDQAGLAPLSSHLNVPQINWDLIELQVPTQRICMGPESQHF